MAQAGGVYSRLIVHVQHGSCSFRLKRHQPRHGKLDMSVALNMVPVRDVLTVRPLFPSSFRGHGGKKIGRKAYVHTEKPA